MKRSILVLVPLLLLSIGCDTGFQRMEPGEHGVLFSALPRFAGGGVRAREIVPGEMEFIFPWQSIYRLKTTRQTIGWGGMGQVNQTDRDDYVETRTRDGNEVGLALTVDYRLDPDRLDYVIQRVGSTDERIREIVGSSARADIRTHMNRLRTEDYFSPTERQTAVDEVKHALNTRFADEGIIIEDVIYVDHRFERRKANGEMDRRYQEQIDKTQQNYQETLQEKKKIETVEQQKQKELNDRQAAVNRQIETAEGSKRQATLRGDGFLQTQQNAAEQVTATGMAEVEGLRSQIQALSGPGGAALLRLQVARELLKSNPKFVLMNSTQSGNKGGIDVNRVDTNDLLQQMGLITGIAEKRREAAAPIQQAPSQETGAENEEKRQ